MICPNCNHTGLEVSDIICPNCGIDLPRNTSLSEQERANILEKSILKGSVAEYQEKEKSYLSQISRLKSYVILLLLCLPISHCICTKEPAKPFMGEFSSGILNNMYKKQLEYDEMIIEELTKEEPQPDVFLYIVKPYDNAYNLSKEFYKTAEFSDTIIKDNTINNTRRIPVGDTIVLRKNPSEYIPNIQKARLKEIRAMRKGNNKE